MWSFCLAEALCRTGTKLSLDWSSLRYNPCFGSWIRNISILNHHYIISENPHLKAFPAKNFKFSSVSPRPQEALNFMLRVLATCIQGTFSGTRKGWRPHSAKALSQRMVAQAWGSWFPWTITTTGREGAQTWHRSFCFVVCFWFYIFK